LSHVCWHVPTAQLLLVSGLWLPRFVKFDTVDVDAATNLAQVPLGFYPGLARQYGPRKAQLSGYVLTSGLVMPESSVKGPSDQRLNGGSP
jgi:hypothetical protein